MSPGANFRNFTVFFYCYGVQQLRQDVNSILHVFEKETKYTQVHFLNMVN